MDLHELCAEYGNQTIADVLGMSRRCLVDIRRGYTAMTIDDFFELERAYPLFDIWKTIQHLGRIRESRGASRSHTMTVDDFFELGRAYPLFNILEIVRCLGRAREDKKVSRKFRPSRRGRKTA